jgi:hypothetical protein
VDPTVHGVDVTSPLDVRVVEMPISDRRPRRIVMGTIVSAGTRDVPMQVVPEQPQRVRLTIQSNSQSFEVWGIGGSPEEVQLTAGNKVQFGAEVKPNGNGTALVIEAWGAVWCKNGNAGDKLHFIAEFVDA